MAEKKAKEDGEGAVAAAEKPTRRACMVTLHVNGIGPVTQEARVLKTHAGEILDVDVKVRGYERPIRLEGVRPKAKAAALPHYEVVEVE
jgi:hypothetical protein